MRELLEVLAERVDAVASAAPRPCIHSFVDLR